MRRDTKQIVGCGVHCINDCGVPCIKDYCRYCIFEGTYNNSIASYIFHIKEE